jgi:hypothetical protein
MAAYGYPRATGDFDIWVEPSAENSRKVRAALASFGAPLDDLQSDTFTQAGIVFQIGVAPRRIDILTAIDGVDFEQAFRDKVDIEIDGLKTAFISRDHLIKNKLSTGRAKDRLDAGHLQKNNTE